MCSKLKSCLGYFLEDPNKEKKSKCRIFPQTSIKDMRKEMKIQELYNEKYWKESNLFETQLGATCRRKESSSTMTSGKNDTDLFGKADAGDKMILNFVRLQVLEDVSDDKKVQEIKDILKKSTTYQDAPKSNIYTNSDNAYRLKECNDVLNMKINPFQMMFKLKEIFEPASSGDSTKLKEYQHTKNVN